MMIRRPTLSTRTATTFPATQLFRSGRGGRACRLPGQRRKLGLDVRDALGLGRSVASGNCSPILAIIAYLGERVGECRFWVRATSDVAAELPGRDRKSTRLNSSH